MSNNNSSNYPGITPIQVNSLTPGATTPNEDALLRMNAANQKLVNMNSIGGRRRHKGGDSGQIAVPQFQMLYQPTGGIDPNSQITSGSITSTQTNADKIYDNQATKMGGRRYRKGGNPNWSWGCYSGGRSKRRHSRKSRKHRKKTRRHRRR
jgi:hypothetical protein